MPITELYKISSFRALSVKHKQKSSFKTYLFNKIHQFPVNSILHKYNVAQIGESREVHKKFNLFLTGVNM